MRRVDKEDGKEKTNDGGVDTEWGRIATEDPLRKESRSPQWGLGRA